MSGKRHHLYILGALIVGATAGALADLLVPDGARDSLNTFIANVTDPVGAIFLRLIFMVVIPLVFSALVLGVVEIGDVRKLGRIGLRTLGFTLIFSTAAVLIGVTAVNVVRPGHMIGESQRKALSAKYKTKADKDVENAKKAKTIRDSLLDIIPKNPLQEMTGAMDGSSPGGGMLAVMFFALFFGVALTMIPPERAAPLVAILQAVFDTCMVIVGIAMRLAPLAVACLLFSATASVGIALLKVLIGFALTVLAALTIQAFLVYPPALRFIAGRSPVKFVRDAVDPIVTSFATSSSNATLPTSLRCAVENLGIPREISHFVLTVGATGNQNGTALYEGIVVLFLAQVFGVHLDLSQQITVVLMSVLAGIGTAGIPGGSLPLIAIVCTTVGVPAEGIAIILGVDRILDMARTTLNVVGDLVIACCVARTPNNHSSTALS